MYKKVNKIFGMYIWYTWFIYSYYYIHINIKKGTIFE